MPIRHIAIRSAAPSRVTSEAIGALRCRVLCRVTLQLDGPHFGPVLFTALGALPVPVAIQCTAAAPTATMEDPRVRSQQSLTSDWSHAPPRLPVNPPKPGATAPEHASRKAPGGWGVLTRPLSIHLQTDDRPVVGGEERFGRRQGEVGRYGGAPSGEAAPAACRSATHATRGRGRQRSAEKFLAPAGAGAGSLVAPAGAGAESAERNVSSAVACPARARPGSLSGREGRGPTDGDPP